MSITVKIGGLVLIASGLLILRNFPGVGSHQKEGMTQTGIFIGAIVSILGVALLIFG